MIGTKATSKKTWPFFFSVPEVNSILKVPLGIIFEDKEVNETEPCYFPKNLDGIFSACQDTEIQVVVVGAGRADLVAQTKAVIQRSMEGDDTMVRGYTLWIMDGSYMGVSKNRGFSPQIIHFNRDFHYIPSILGYPYFWKHPYGSIINPKTNMAGSWRWISYCYNWIWFFFPSPFFLKQMIEIHWGIRFCTSFGVAHNYPVNDFRANKSTWCHIWSATRRDFFCYRTPSASGWFHCFFPTFFCRCNHEGIHRNVLWIADVPSHPSYIDIQRYLCIYIYTQYIYTYIYIYT